MLIDGNLAIFLATPVHFHIYLEHGRAALADFLGFSLAEDWPIFADAPAQALAAEPRAGPAQFGTWLGLDLEQRCLMAFGGFAAMPDAQGRVIFGYAIARQWRGRGWGLRYAALLQRIAYADRCVRLLQAHTLGEGVVSPEGFDNSASTAVLRHLGFRCIGADVEDGMPTLTWVAEPPAR